MSSVYTIYKRVCVCVCFWGVFFFKQVGWTRKEEVGCGMVVVTYSIYYGSHYPVTGM